MSKELVVVGKGAETPIVEQNLTSLLEEFLASQDVKESSRQLYKRTLRPFFLYLQEKEIPLKAVSRADILRYKDKLLDAAMSPLTVGSYLTVVRKFFGWAEALKYYPNVAKGIKTPTRKQQYRKQALTTDQGRKLLHYFQEQSLRDYALVNLMICTGLRCIEVSRANVEDITLKSQEGSEAQRVLLVQGKGRLEKDSFVILSEAVYQPIKAYLDTRLNAKAKEPLFSSTSNTNKGGSLTTRTISKIAKAGLCAIGLDDRAFTAHSLRHSAASILIKNGATAEEVKDVLRHASTAITQIYYASVAEEVRLGRNTEAKLSALLH
jgi:integrase/recombinase XerC/integrase/recombinase XerD